MEQDILIYVDEKEKLDASVAANAFAHKDVKNRAYINTLGAELALKYLVSENIDIAGAKNIHSIKKILEETDIADIILPNIHIDVRVVFDENAIFIPKSHFEYNLTPDIYLVFNLSADRSYVRFLGFFEPKLINKNNANSEYYFIEKEKLSSSRDLIDYINSHKNNFSQKLSDSDMESCEQFIVAMSDNDISESDKRYLLSQLVKSSELRDKFIEYENFETLSYKAMNDPIIEKKEIQSVDTFEEMTTPIDIPELEGLSNSEVTDLDSTEEIESVEDIVLPDSFEENTEKPEVSTEDNISNTIEDNALSIGEELLELPSDNVLAMGEELTDFVPNIDIDLNNGDSLPLETSIETDIENNLEDFTAPEELVTLDEIVTTQNNDTISEPVSDTIELEDLQIPEMDETQEVYEEEPPLETLSLENVKLESIEPLATENIDEVADIETISLDDVETTNTTEELPINEVQPELLSFEELPEQTNNNEIEESENFGFNEIPDIIEATDNFDNIPTETTDIQNSDESINIEELPEIIEDNELNFGEAELSVEDNVQIEDSSFGKNLLENLAAEENDDINIDMLDSSQESNDISSNELLSQIDDVLNASATEGNINNDSILENIEGIEGFENIDNIDDIVNNANDLNILYNQENPPEEVPIPEEGQEQQIPGAGVYNKGKSGNKKQLAITGTLLVALAVSAGLFILKPKDDSGNTIEQPLPMNNNNNTITEQPTSPLSTEDILTTNTPQPAPVDNKDNKEIKVTKQEVKELKNTPPKITNSSSRLEVNRLVWDVPDVLSQSSKIQNYLRTAGKSIKLSLSTDLLLATEYAYTNQVRVGLTLNNDGSIQESKILSSSGSSQIDNIVLQSVKDTLNVVKPPSDEIKSPNFKLNLIIYF